MRNKPKAWKTKTEQLPIDFDLELKNFRDRLKFIREPISQFVMTPTW